VSPSSTTPAGDGVRSLADDLRSRSDEDLARLLLARPDLARPAPSDLTALAARSTTRSSSQRAIDGLDLTTLQVLTAAVVHGGDVTVDALLPLLGADGGRDLALPDPTADAAPSNPPADATPPAAPADAALPSHAALAGALATLRDQALLWGPDGALRVSRGAADVLGPHPAGLGPLSVELGAELAAGLDAGADAGSRADSHATTGPDPSPTNTEALRSLLADAPPEASAVLDSLTWGPPLAHVPAPGTRAAAGVDWLVDRGLLARTDDQVVLPREVGLAARGGRLFREPAFGAPVLTGSERNASLIDRVGGGSASEVLALVDDLLSAWSLAPPRTLRGGGLAVRDLNVAARSLDTDARDAGLLLELALMAGLVAEDDAEDAHWAPTLAYDEWLDQPGGQRWADLAQAWWTSTRDAARVGQKRADGKTINALGPDVHDPPGRPLRHVVLTTLAQAPPHRAVDRQALLDSLRWQRPRRLPADLPERVDAVLAQANRLGLVALDALTAGGRALVAGDAEALAASMETHLPSPVDHLLLQADLTAVAPGPLAGGLAHFIRQVADLESRGGASVHRFSEGSIRRALDAGWSADDILRGLGDASRTEIPQPLDYLVRDTARRHGQIRVSEARSCIRVEDPSALEALVASRDLGLLQLRRVASTVAISPMAPDVVVDLIQESGVGVVRESASGAITISARPRHRAVPDLPRAPVLHRLDEASAASAVAELRAADATHTANTALGVVGASGYEGSYGSGGTPGGRRTTPRPPLVPTGDPTTSLVMLREASADRRTVWVGYSDAAGIVRRFLFTPETVEHGRVHGVADGTRRTLSIHRITGVSAD
jgi:hypothetical protein